MVRSFGLRSDGLNSRFLLQPVREKMRLEMLKGLQNEIQIEINKLSF